MRKIVVVGGGAGGLELATRLGDSVGKRGKARIVLVDRFPTHFWKPMLHEVAAGKMDPSMHQIEYAAHAAQHHFEFVRGGMAALDRAEKTIEIAACADQDGVEILPARRLHYDTLVLAFGAVTNFFGVPGAAEHCVALDTVFQAEAFRRTMIATILREDSDRSHAPAAKKGIDVAIVGGGATGVELAAELRSTAVELARYNVHQLDPNKDIRITIIEAGPRILPHLTQQLSERAASMLASLNVSVATTTCVASVSRAEVIARDGARFPADIAVWAAGIAAPALCASFGLPVNRIGQLKVGPSLQTESDPDVFAIGDCASVQLDNAGAALPPRAQVAHQQALFLARVLALFPDNRNLPPFRYRDYGSLVSIGPLSAVGALAGGFAGKGMFVEGLFARVMYSSLYRKHVMALHGVRRMVLDTLMHWFRARVGPSVKLH